MKVQKLNGYTLITYKDFTLRNGVLVQGLPGIGLVGKIAVDYIVSSLNLEKVAEIIGPGIMLPSGNVGVYVTNEGWLQLPSYKFYVYNGSERDILFLTSEVQPATWAQHEVAERVLDLFVSMGGREVVGVCGTAVEEPEARVYYALASGSVIDKLEALGARRSGGGTITGACGLLPALASLRGLDAFVLMGSTQTSEPNFIAAKEVITALSKLYGLNVNLEEIEKVIAKIKEKEEEALRIAETAKQKEGEQFPSWYV
ncbi:MAG: PAC2 family protein [Thermofilum sp.]|nr:PAC2 family protein [Thermofilum sp.]